ncbi:unnamed protein product (macronuclear) [Paramecium tetraurelia]|uniref:Uncharacterized protein n=1 Tax=Paramecium tetraurelia TaxID=5888 RepID=A0BQ42_PARTE|nr:uncharacterized protein GSPATT00005410001 [Paramecium tetraurelia]CAK60659.1 unnamed protein product [Paramecium tetraurelia]|eukprot:XP_001428057.1 hypothetical protein (macronuclear) [Paramecium tetraurelia strain d4-2]
MACAEGPQKTWMEFIAFTAFVVVVASQRLPNYSYMHRLYSILGISGQENADVYIHKLGILINHLCLWSLLHLRVHLRLGFEHCQIILVRKTHFSDIQIYLQEQNTDLIFRFTKDIMPFQRGLFHSHTIEFWFLNLNK